MSVRKIIGVVIGLLVITALSAQKPKSYKLKVGQEFTLDVRIEVDMEQDIMGEKQGTKQTINNMDKYEVVSKETNGYRLKVTGVKRKVIMNSQAMNIDMDSDQEGDEHVAMRALTGKVYYLNIDKYGKVIKIDDFLAYKAEVKAAFDGTSLAGQADEVLASVSEKNALTTFESFFYIYSPSGEKNWQNEYTVTLSGLPINITLDYSRPNAKQMVANGKLDLTGDIEVQGTKMQAELLGSQITIFQLDKKTGLSKTVDMTQDLLGELKVQSLSVPMTVKTKSKATITW